MNDILGYIGGLTFLLGVFGPPLVLVVMACIRDSRRFKMAAAVVFVLVSLFFSSCSYSRSGFAPPDGTEAQERMWRFGHTLIMESELSTEFYSALIAILLAVLLNRSGKPTEDRSGKSWKRGLR